MILIDSSRVYAPPDPPGYFDGHVWPMYLKNRREMEDVEPDIGESSIETGFSQQLHCYCGLDVKMCWGFCLFFFF